MAKVDPTTSSVIEIKNYPTALIHKHKSEKGDEFNSISFMWKDKWASFVLNPGAISQSISRKGNAIEGKMNIFLGEADQVRNVSVLEADSSYRRQPMFNRTILAEITSQRENYLKSIAI